MTLSSDESIDLVREAQAGCSRSFSTLWRRHAPAVHCVLLTIVSDDEAAALTVRVEELAERALPSLQRLELFPSWLCALARGVGYRAREAARGDRANADASPTSSEQPGPARALAADEILRQIRRLPTRYREPLMLRLVLRLTGPEIVQLTGATERAIRCDLLRGLCLLRRCLERIEGETCAQVERSEPRAVRFWARPFRSWARRPSRAFGSSG